MIDNFSRRILAWRVADTFAPVISVAVLVEASPGATPSETVVFAAEMAALGRAFRAAEVSGRDRTNSLTCSSTVNAPPDISHAETPDEVSRMAALDQILDVAEGSPVASFRWRDRGVAPRGYVKGMSVVYARVYCKLKAGEPGAIEMAKADMRNRERDALTWYAELFDEVGMDNHTAGVETLRHLFVLLIGLGMRESSGRHCEGRDRSASNVTADTAEAGLFQTSFNASRANGLLPPLFQQYLRVPSGFVEIFKEGVACRSLDLENFGTGPGRDFQRLSKECPAFAAEFAAIGLRHFRKHWGPINRKEVQLVPECDAMLRSVQEVADASDLCPMLL